MTTYVADEDETFHGARIHARYRIADTWVRREGGLEARSCSQVLALRTDPPALPTHRRAPPAYCGRYTLGDLTYVVQCGADGLTGGQLGRPPSPSASSRRTCSSSRRAADAPHLPARCIRACHRIPPATRVVGPGLETCALTADGASPPRGTSPGRGEASRFPHPRSAVTAGSRPAGRRTPPPRPSRGVDG